MGIEIKKLIEAFRAEGVESRCRRHPKIFLALKKPTSTSTGFFFFSFLLFFFLSPKLAPCTSLAPNLQKTTTALAAPSVEPADDNEPAVALIKPLPPPKPVIVVSNAAAPLLGPADLAPAANATAAAAPAPAKAAAAPAPAVAAAAAATPAKAPAPQPKANTTATPPAFSAYTLSAAQATLSPDPATEGLATLILKGLSNVTIPRGSAGVLNGPMHTPTFLATSFPAGSTVELRGSAAAGGGGDWGSCYLRKATLVASGTADGVAVLSGVVVPASLGDAGQATFGTQRGTLVFNKVSVLVTAPPKKWSGATTTQKLVAAAPSPSPAAAPAATTAAAKAPAPAPAKNATTATTTTTTPKVSVAAATRPVASVRSVPMPSEFSN